MQHDRMDKDRDSSEKPLDPAEKHVDDTAKPFDTPKHLDPADPLLATTYEHLETPVKAFVDRQHFDAYRLIDAVRHPVNGLYSDAYDTFAEGPVPMGSIAATGVGLAALAIAHVQGWDASAGPKAVTTLTSVLNGAAPRDPLTGFYYHFHDLESGEVWGRSEISTIDTSILVAGARLAAHYLGDAHPEVRQLTLSLMASIRWETAFGDPEKGEVFMVIEEGKGKGPGPLFNEYAIVSSVAKDADPTHPQLSAFWHAVHAPERVPYLPTREYRGFRLLVDTPPGGSFLSSFVCQFPLYLIPEYAVNDAYLRLVEGACHADRLSWQVAGEFPSYVWGHGAGANHGLPDASGRPAGYCVDAINRSSGVASAYIIAGFLPVYPWGIFDLYAWYRLHLPYDTYQNHDDPTDESLFRKAYRFGLHRFSWAHRQQPDRWYPRQITIIDWSTMLYGLTALKRGMSFFALQQAPSTAQGGERPAYVTRLSPPEVPGITMSTKSARN